MTTASEQLRKAAERIRGTAKNPHLGLDEWYPAHPGDDAAIKTQRRAYQSDIIAVAEFVMAHLASEPVHGRCNACGHPNKPDGCCSRSGCCNSD